MERDPRKPASGRGGTGAARSPAVAQPERWVDDHGDALFRYALLRVRDRATAEDLVQETFLAAIKAQPTFKGDSELRTWLIGILRHKTIDHLRQLGRQGGCEQPDESDPLIDSWFAANGRWASPPKQWDVDPAQLAERQEFWEVLRRCLGGVSGRAGEAFSMRVMSDVSADDVCRLMDITPTNLWVLLHRARARLRACLEVNWFGQRSEEQA